MQNGADFTIKSISELPQLIEKINQLISEGKRTSCKISQNLNREGDINFSPLRTEWMNQLNNKSVENIQADERVL